jgi:hypothetical protein
VRGGAGPSLPEVVAACVRGGLAHDMFRLMEELADARRWVAPGSPRSSPACVRGELAHDIFRLMGELAGARRWFPDAKRNLTDEMPSSGRA